jgi:hypothetical protein
MSGLSAPSSFFPPVPATGLRTMQRPDVPTGPIPFEPDTILPAQWFAVHSRMLADPCARLHLAVLEDAVETLRRLRGVDSLRARVARYEVEEWLRDADAKEADYRISFRTAVDVVFGDRVEAEDLAKSILKAAERFGPRAVTFQRQARTRRDRY